MREYDVIAEWYASERVDHTGVPEALALAKSICTPGRIVDIGCGNGIPITRTLLSAGHRVIGVDSSVEMLKRFQRNCPATPVVRANVQACPFADASFDGAVAWGVLFHLAPDDAVDAIASVSRILRPGAPFLFTAGYVDGDDRDDDHVGMMNGVEFHYYSFTIDGYRSVLSDHGFTLVDFHTDSGKNGYYLANRR